MNTHTTEIGSEQNNAFMPRQRRLLRTGLPSLTRSVFRARAVFRLARRRPILALGLAVGLTSAVWTVGSAASTETADLLHSAAMLAGVAPL